MREVSDSAEPRTSTKTLFIDSSVVIVPHPFRNFPDVVSFVKTIFVSVDFLELRLTCCPDPVLFCSHLPRHLHLPVLYFTFYTLSSTPRHLHHAYCSNIRSAVRGIFNIYPTLFNTACFLPPTHERLYSCYKGQPNGRQGPQIDLAPTHSRSSHYHVSYWKRAISIAFFAWCGTAVTVTARDFRILHIVLV